IPTRRSSDLAGTALSLGMVAYGGQASAACVGPVDGVVTCSPGDYGSITYINPDDPTFELDVGEEGEETTITPPAGEHGIAVWHNPGSTTDPDITINVVGDTVINTTINGGRAGIAVNTILEPGKTGTVTVNSSALINAQEQGIKILAGGEVN